MSHRKMFINRLKEAGVHYVMKNIKNGYTIITVPYETRKSDEQWYRDTYAVQGLIYHFSNRNWIVSDTYMFINQASHVIKFNEKEKYAKNDLQLRRSFTAKFEEITERINSRSTDLKSVANSHVSDSFVRDLSNGCALDIIEDISLLKTLFNEFKNNRFQ